MSDAFDLSQAVFDGSPNIADWPITSPVTAVEVNHRGVIVSTPKLEGADRWPDFVPSGWAGPLQYTLSMALQRPDGWHAMAVLSFWYKRGTHNDDAGGDVLLPDQISKHWLYDSRFGAMQHAQPVVGESVGFFVAAGSQRYDPGVIQTVRERSNVVLVRWPAQPAVFTFEAPGPVPEPPGPTPEPVPPADLALILARLSLLEAEGLELEANIGHLQDRLSAEESKPLPDYIGTVRIFGYPLKVISKPVV